MPNPHGWFWELGCLLASWGPIALLVMLVPIAAKEMVELKRGRIRIVRVVLSDQRTPGVKEYPNVAFGPLEGSEQSEAQMIRSIIMSRLCRPRQGEDPYCTDQEIIERGWPGLGEYEDIQLGLRWAKYLRLIQEQLAVLERWGYVEQVPPHLDMPFWRCTDAGYSIWEADQIAFRESVNSLLSDLPIAPRH